MPTAPIPLSEIGASNTRLPYLACRPAAEHAAKVADVLAVHHYIIVVAFKR